MISASSSSSAKLNPKMIRCDQIIISYQTSVCTNLSTQLHRSHCGGLFGLGWSACGLVKRGTSAFLKQQLYNMITINVSALFSNLCKLVDIILIPLCGYRANAFLRWEINDLSSITATEMIELRWWFTSGKLQYKAKSTSIDWNYLRVPFESWTVGSNATRATAKEWGKY